MTSILQIEAVGDSVRHDRTHVHTAVWLLALTGPLAAVSNADAQSIGISVLNTQYSTDLEAQATEEILAPPPSYEVISTTTKKAAQTNTSKTPLSHAIDVSVGQPYAKATASADMFSVSVSTASFYGPYPFAKANARSVLQFSSLMDQSGPLTLSFAGNGVIPMYSDGFVSLDDVTTDQPVFNYSWKGYVGSVPWDLYALHKASIAVALSLQASHSYALTLNTSTYANHDFEAVSIQVSGLAPVVTSVPEPHIGGMLLAGLGLLGYKGARRRHRKDV